MGLAVPSALHAANSGSTHSSFLGSQLAPAARLLATQTAGSRTVVAALFSSGKLIAKPVRASLQPWAEQYSELVSNAGRGNIEVSTAAAQFAEQGDRQVQKFNLRSVGPAAINPDDRPLSSGEPSGLSKDAELFVGRLSMFGIAGTLIAELATGKGALALLGIQTGVPLRDVDGFILALIAFNVVTALSPAKGNFVDEDERLAAARSTSFKDPTIALLRPGKAPPSAGSISRGFGFGGLRLTKEKELLIGRIAQLLFAGILLGEALTGQGVLQMLQMETGLPEWEIEPVLVLLMGFLLFVGVNPGTGRFTYDEAGEDDFDEDWLED